MYSILTSLCKRELLGPGYWNLECQDTGDLQVLEERVSEYD